MPELDANQLAAVEKMKNGCILCSETGSGKSRTALAYYVKVCRKLGVVLPLYVITTAKKRDSGDWGEEYSAFDILPNQAGILIVDSWNNIGKYVDRKNSFFIFDEQRVVGSGEWSKSFLKITKANQWILLSATPGDTWKDYIPVFIANGFYRNRTEFAREHIIYSHFTNYPKIEDYANKLKLYRLRDSILVDMDCEKHTRPVHEDMYVDYDISLYRTTMRTQWNPFTNEPINTAGELCYALRKICNMHPSRLEALRRLYSLHHRAIVFYNFDYELEILRSFCKENGIIFSEWNGHKHEKIPDGENWLYLVQYTAGAEGWNCITADTVIFFSQNYSYKVLVQACGRIDRRNTPYTTLFYYHLKSHSMIDIAISRALHGKKQFNEQRFVTKLGSAKTVTRRAIP